MTDNHDLDVDFHQLLNDYEDSADNYKDLRQFADRLENQRRGIENDYLHQLKETEDEDKWSTTAEIDDDSADEADRAKSALATIGAIQKRAYERLDQLATERYLNDANRYRPKTLM